MICLTEAYRKSMIMQRKVEQSLVELNRSAVEGFFAVTSVSSKRFLPLRSLTPPIIRSCV